MNTLFERTLGWAFGKMQKYIPLLNKIKKTWRDFMERIQLWDLLKSHMFWGRLKFPIRPPQLEVSHVSKNREPNHPA